jgi:hypothetical protein
MGQQEKSAMTRGLKYANEHESDALAAAIFAYRHFENKLRLIDRVAGERGISDKAEEIKRLALGGLSVHTILLLLEEQKSKTSGEGKEIEKQASSSHFPRPRAVLVEEIASLARTNEELRKAMERLERENSELRGRISMQLRAGHSQVVRDREIRYRDRLIYHLKELLQRRRSKKKPVDAKLQASAQASPVNTLKEYPAKGKNAESLDIDYMVEAYRRSGE